MVPPDHSSIELRSYRCPPQSYRQPVACATRDGTVSHTMGGGGGGGGLVMPGGEAGGEGGGGE
jgi:hypothetical protein